MYLDARYVSACEGCWRLYHFWMHEEKPAIVRLQVHTEDEQLVTWNNEIAEKLQKVLENKRAQGGLVCAPQVPSSTGWIPIRILGIEHLPNNGEFLQIF